MGSVKRIYVEKREGFDISAQHLFSNLKEFLHIENLEGVRIVIRYDIEGISDEDATTLVNSGFLTLQGILAASAEDLVEMAAALFESLIMNHPFVDGNKRVAFFGTDVFLRLNGYKFEVAVYEAYPFLIKLLERGECSYENLLPWIRLSIVKL